MTVYIIVKQTRKDGSYIVSAHSAEEKAIEKMALIAYEGIYDFEKGEIWTSDDHYYIVSKVLDSGK